jgi:hypothetical protein
MNILSSKPQAVYCATVASESHKLAQYLANHSKDWHEICNAYVCAVGNKLAYGRTLYQYNEPFVKKNVELYTEFQNAAGLYYYIVNSLPFLRHLPA